MRVHALGVDLRLRVEDPGLRTLLGRVLKDLVVDGGAGTGAEEVTVCGRGPWRVRSAASTAEADDVSQALTQALTAVNQLSVERCPLLAFHAAVLTRHGGSLVVPGRSGSGKSTLAAALVRRGWDYVSDEALALDWTTGVLVAYPRPLALSPWSAAALGGVDGVPGDRETVVCAGDLGGTVDRRPGAVRQVVLLDRGDLEEPPSITRVDRNDALTELLQRGFTHHRDGGRALVLATSLLQHSEVARLRLGDPAAAAALLTAWVDDG